VQDVARIVLAVESEQMAHDVIDYLDRSGRAVVVDTVRDPDAVASVVHRERPDAVVASPFLIPPGSLNGSPLLAIGVDESVRTLRRAVDAGARGFFVWPGDRKALAAATATSADANGSGSLARRGTVVGVYGPRGGVGATFLATHLAAAFAARRQRTILIDADLAVGDLTWALGVPPDAAVRTLGDLEPVRDEITRAHLDNVLWTHASGVEVLLAPREPGSTLDPTRMERVVDVAAGSSDVVVVHLARSPESVRPELVGALSRLLVVVSLDVSAFRAAKRALEGLGGDVAVDIVVNRAKRGAVTPGDVERVFGKPAVCVLPCDRKVGVVQDRGELVPARSRLGRAVRRLAADLVEHAA
jgi:pilus assembly protein CpaE